MFGALGKELIIRVGKGLLLRLGAYALFLWGFWLLFKAFEGSSIGLGVGGGAAILVAMWAMVGFRRFPSLKPNTNNDESGPNRDDGTRQ